MPYPIRVVIADDQMLVREGLRELMKHWDEFEIVGEAANGKEAVDICRDLQPDMVLMDVQMPIMDGVGATKVIASDCPNTSVIMLTVALDDDSLFGALRNGAKGYVLKDTSSKELRSHLKGVAKGEFPLSGLAATKLVNRIGPGGGAAEKGNAVEEEIAACVSMFTPREIEILKLAAEGLSNKEIGDSLYLSAGTVKKHMSSIMQKLGLENRVQVATFAYRAGIMD